jgi:hypothetical protein
MEKAAKEVAPEITPAEEIKVATEESWPKRRKR